MRARGLIVAAPRSASGKTTVTLALLAALRRRGVAVRAAKAGPDYIDTAFHAAATGIPGYNLDSWAMPEALLDALAGVAAHSAELIVIEGAMGLFDGVPAAPGRSGSAADLAARFHLPVLLVLDVSGQSQTAAAVVRGLAAHDPAVRIAGVVLNRVASERHRRLVSEAIADLGVPVLGAVPRDETLALPERHLGLVQAVEHADLQSRLERLANMAERHFDLDAILAGAAPFAMPSPSPSPPRKRGSIAAAEVDSRLRGNDGYRRLDAGEAPLTRAPALPPPGQRIALASDAAFSFVYTHLLDGWRQQGAEAVAFSPLADEPPPKDCDSCWLPGGYPELHAGRLAAACRFREGLREFAATRPVHGECGGYMVLGESLEDADGVRHAMTGLLGHATSFRQRRLSLGYREARLLAASPIGPAGAVIRGHEFHYATLLSMGSDAPLAEFRDAGGKPLGKAGGLRERVTGTFFHAIASGEFKRSPG